MERRARIVSAMLILAFTSQAAGCGGTSQSATAQDAQAKSSVERALRVVASDYEDFHNYDLVSAFTLRNLDHSLRAVSSLHATGTGSTFTVSVRSASGTTFEVDGKRLRLTRVCRPPSTDCPGGRWPGSLSLAVAPTPRLTAAQEARVRRILLSSVGHYEDLLRRGQQTLGTTQYPNAQAGLNAFSDPNSAASQFSRYQKDANLYGSASYLDAFNRADRFFTAANEPQAITDWEDKMSQAQGDLAQWVHDAVSWQISEVQSTVLRGDVAAFEADLAKARTDALMATPGASGAKFSTSSTSSTESAPPPTSTASSTTNATSSVPSWVLAARKGCPAGELLVTSGPGAQRYGNDGCVSPDPGECAPSEPTCDPANAPGGTPATQTTTPTTAPAPQSSGYVRCPNATLKSGGQAKIAITSGAAICALASTVIRDAISAHVAGSGHIDSGGVWSVAVAGYTCMTGGDGTIMTCYRGSGTQLSMIIGTTPTPGGYWPDPVP